MNRTKLGPRALPHLRHVIEMCVSILKGSSNSKNSGKRLTIYSFVSLQSRPAEAPSEALASLTSILKSIPSFWGIQEVKAVVSLVTDGTQQESSKPSTQLEKLSKLLAKQLPSRILLSALMQSWPSSSITETEVHTNLFFPREHN